MTSSAPVPIGVFWDIENCSVPKWKSALSVVRSLRDNFFTNRREVEFMCVCDTTKSNKDVIQELNSAQVDIVHINATSKNAADDKLRQSLRRFADTHPAPAVIVLISSDINFASDLSDLRHRKGYHIILIHSKHVHEALKLCANENFLYEDIVKCIPRRQPDVSEEGKKELSVSGFPSDVPSKRVESRLKKLSTNCGGRVVSVTRKLALLRFASADDAIRAKTRMDGENVFGNTIKVEFPENMGTADSTQSTQEQADSIQLASDVKSVNRRRSKSRDRKQGQTNKGNTNTPHKSFQREATHHQKPHKEIYQMDNSLQKNQEMLASGGSTLEDKSGSCDGGKDQVETNNDQGCNQEEKQDLQSVVDKFSKDHKSSRQVLMLQQQLYQEGQETSAQPSSQPIFEHDLNHMLSNPPPSLYQGHYGFQRGQGHYSLYSSSQNSDGHYNQQDHGYGSYSQRRYQQKTYQPSNNFYGNSVHNTSFDSQTYNGFQNHFKDRSYHMYGPSNQNLNQSFSAFEMYKSINHDSTSKAGSYNKPNRYQTNSYNYSSSYSSSYFYQNQNGQRQSTYNNLPYSSNQNVDSSRNSPSGFGSQNSFRPIRVGSPSTGSSSPCDQEVTDWDSVIGPVELLISNLDYNISAKEWRKILFTTFHPHVRVLNVHVKTQPDNTSIGMVKVSSKEEARFAISQFHRKKIGYKRIHVTLKNEEGQRPASTSRMEAVALLSEAKDNMLPLFKFIELFDKRYHRSISVSELYKMRDIIEIREQGGAGRMVYLASSLQNPTPITENADGEIQEILEQPVCLVHCPEGSAVYAEAVNSYMLPNVKMSLKSLAPQVHSLLQTHDGNMPLMSFPACFTAEFSSLPVALVTQGGVPLEHLISCVPGIQIQVSPSGVKKVQWAENHPPAQTDVPRPSPASPMLSQQVNQICREMVDLLKQSPQCRMPVSKFIPSYHHFFGRQCRVADYGYSRLKDLFEAIPHVVQVLGTGDRKMLTLSHRAQMRRFTNDLVKLLKAQPGKQLPVNGLVHSFSKMMNRQWDITEYGMSHLDDLLSELSASTAVILTEGGENIVAIPRKDQSNEEIERTKQFALEVVDLLKHNPQCRMPFNKFIPAYHHHFGRQCRVSDYGFSKLIDLFEAIPHVVELEEEGEERLIHLTEPELRKILAEQIVGLLKQQKNQWLPLHHLMSTFTCHYGFNIPLYDFNVDCEEDLMNKIKHVVKVEMINRCKYIMLRNRSETPKLAHQVLQLLMDQSGGSLPLLELSSRYMSIYNIECNIKKIKEELLDFVQVIGDDESAVISLTPLQAFARDVRLLLLEHGRIFLSHFDRFYRDRFGVELKPALFGCPTSLALLQTIPHIATIGGKPPKKYCQLSSELTGDLSPRNRGGEVVRVSIQRPGSDGHSSDSGVTDTKSDEEEISAHEQPPLRTKPDDLMAGKVPSTIPSPDLKPVPENLMVFDTKNTDVQESVWILSEDEKRGQKTPLCRTPTSDLLNFAAQCLISHPPPSRMTQTNKPEDTTLLTVPSQQGSFSSLANLDVCHTGDNSAGACNAKSNDDTEDASGWWKASVSQMEEIRQSFPKNLPKLENTCQNQENGAGPLRGGKVDKEQPISSKSPELVEMTGDSQKTITILKRSTKESVTEMTAKPDSDQQSSAKPSKTFGKDAFDVQDVKSPSGTLCNVGVVSKHKIQLPKKPGKGEDMHSFMLSADSATYSLFRQEMPLETSSVKSDSSTLSDVSQGSPRKSPRKKRIAAKFDIPIDVENQLSPA